jgi:AcrR family transcriptional regulator
MRFKRSFMRASSAAIAVDTRTRLLDAAAACFAERGFHGTTIRQIAERAGVNVAAGHYHIGSKKDLYLAVLREQFRAVRAALDASAATPGPAALARCSRADVEALLHRRTVTMLGLLLGPPPSLHGTLMQREMCDPSEALPWIVAEFIRPLIAELEQLIARLEPRLDDTAIERCAFSVVGQALFYRLAMPVLATMWGEEAFAPSLSKSLGRHIAEFSLGGLARLAASRPAPRHGRSRRPKAHAR